MALRSTIDRSRGDSRRRRVALAVVSVVLVVSAAQTLASERTDRPALGPMGPEVPPRPASIGESAADPSAGPLNLSIRADPSAICSEESDLCPAGTGVAQVTLTATAPPPNPDGWSAAEVAFVIETTPYDGVYDPTEGGSVGDACAASGGPLCEESNGVPFFVTHAGAVAEAITAEHPTTEVSFALVDYFATWDGDDDGDGTSFHVDISQFVAASQFGPAVKSTFQAEQLDGGFVYPDSDLSDNFLDSSSISALYASLEGSALNWSESAHHVLVWVGSSAPRDPGYPEDYAVSPSVNEAPSSGCEPASETGGVAIPQCEGWVTPHDNAPGDAIAVQALSTPECTGSPGGQCTIDAVDLFATPTDPASPGWPCSATLRSVGGCPNGPAVRTDAVNILEAGCDIAAATGGTWDGPETFACPGVHGAAGTLAPEFVGPDPWSPETQNPSLFQALESVGFGLPSSGPVILGSSEPMFQFLDFGNIRVLEPQTISASCRLPGGAPFSSCDRSGETSSDSGVEVFQWNWSRDPSENGLPGGAVWSVSFLVFAAGPPFATVPVDACITPLCQSLGSSSVAGLYTSATYRPVSTGQPETDSFPLARITVEGPTEPGAPIHPPATPPTPPTTAPPLPPVPVLTTASQLLGGAAGLLSIPALIAGAMVAGFVRMATRSQRVAQPMVALTRGPRGRGSSFEPPEARDTVDGRSRFE